MCVKAMGEERGGGSAPTRRFRESGFACLLAVSGLSLLGFAAPDGFGLLGRFHGGCTTAPFPFSRRVGACPALRDKIELIGAYIRNLYDAIGLYSP